MKRRRQEGEGSTSQGLPDAESAVLNLIKSKKNLGIGQPDIKKEAKLPPSVVEKSLTSLVKKNLIKTVKHRENKAKKHYMAVEFEPSEEVTGGAWYDAGNLDQAFINTLRGICLGVINKLQVTTAERIFRLLEEKKAMKVKCTSKQIEEVMRSMVLDNSIIEVKSTGLGEYHSIPVGEICYRFPSAAAAAAGKKKAGAMASIPCGVCPTIADCTPDGIISPKTCVYYSKWLDIEF